MSFSNAISRFTEFYKRHGLAAMIVRARLAGQRALFAGRMAVFYCDLDAQKLPRISAPRTMRVERITALAELSAEHLQAMTSFWNPKLAIRNVRERFEKGAALWMVKCEGQLAGYGWAIRGQTIEPYYVPLGTDDVHLFDFHVLPPYRGRGINPYLVGEILVGLATDCLGRAFIEAAEWNGAQLSSLRKTPFRLLGLARSFTVLGRTFVSWKVSGDVMQMHKENKPTAHNFKAVRSNEN
jgi:GNAT superfamily N-acetyltransferase